MKSIFKTALVLGALISTSSYAQEFYGTATYISKRSIKATGITDEQKQSLPEGVAEMIAKQTEDLFNKTYTLRFDRSASLFEEVEKPQELEVNPNSNIQISITSEGDAKEILYKDLKNKIFIKESTIYEKTFLIKDSLPAYQWELQSDTKKIGDYTVKKAIYKYKTNKARIEALSGFTDTAKIPDEITITAWYTTDIPVTNGPAEYTGLPGLILELNDGQISYLCSKIIINPKDKPAIKAPKNGKVVTVKKFNEIKAKKSAELLEKYKRSSGDGNSIQIITHP